MSAHAVHLLIAVAPDAGYLVFSLWAGSTVGIVLVVAAVAKLRSVAGFVTSARHGLPAPLRPMVGALPPIELVAGVACLIPFSRTAGLVVAAGLLSLFALLAVRSARSTARLRCNCFGTGTAELTWVHAGRSLVLLGVCAAGAAATLSGPAPAAGEPPVLLALTLTGAVVTASAAIFLDDLVAVLA